MKKISKIWVIVAVIVVAAAAAFLLSGNKEKEEVEFATEAVGPANIENSITATGTIEPVTSVTVGTQVSGIVSKLYVDYNSVVKKGQVIAELDKTNLMSELNTAKANLASARSTLDYRPTSPAMPPSIKGAHRRQRLRPGPPVLPAGPRTSGHSPGECAEGADQSGLRHHHFAHRRRGAFQERGGGTDGGRQLQHA